MAANDWIKTIIYPITLTFDIGQC